MGNVAAQLFGLITGLGGGAFEAGELAVIAAAGLLGGLGTFGCAAGGPGLVVLTDDVFHIGRHALPHITQFLLGGLGALGGFSELVAGESFGFLLEGGDALLHLAGVAFDTQGFLLQRFGGVGLALVGALAFAQAVPLVLGIFELGAGGGG